MDTRKQCNTAASYEHFGIHKVRWILTTACCRPTGWPQNSKPLSNHQ